MKLHKVALWNKRKMYYILNSIYVLDLTLEYDLRVSYMSTKDKLETRLQDCTIVHKQ